MGSTNGTEMNIGKELVQKAYDDVAHPAARSTGELVELVPRAIKAALSPLEIWILHKEYNVDRTKQLLQEKLKNVKPENICSPEPHIAVPALQYISYCMDNDELRDMYANLLANSMNKVVKNGVHPAFVEIIRQLCPDEAKILKEMKGRNAIPTITLRAEDETGGGIDLVRNFSDITESAHCEDLAAYEQYFNNLVRLGLLNYAEKYQRLKSNTLYEPLETHELVLGMKKMVPFIDGQHTLFKIEKSFIYITSFGKALCKVCLGNAN